MKGGGAETAALAERYLDFWERWMATAMQAPAASWSFEAWLAMVNAARLRAEREVGSGGETDDPGGTEI